MTPLVLHAPCKDYLWGGQRLRRYGKRSDADRIAESWELSCHPDGESVIAAGEFAGMTLTQLLKEHPALAGERCRRYDRFPVLVKLIDAADRLSVQVHPDDAYALEHEHQPGKTEAWYIVEAEPGAEILYGFSEPMTPESLRAAIGDGTLLNKVRHVPVKRGDVCYIPAGTLHALGKGILAAEIQQNSNVTYRIFDYGRPRELHIEQALAVTSLAPCRMTPAPPPGRAPVQLAATIGDICVFLYRVHRSLHLPGNPATFLHLLVTEGEGVLTHADGSIPLRPGMSLFLPAGRETYQITGSCTILGTGLVNR